MDFATVFVLFSFSSLNNGLQTKQHQPQRKCEQVCPKFPDAMSANWKTQDVVGIVKDSSMELQGFSARPPGNSFLRRGHAGDAESPAFRSWLNR
jgi:hypothetical protein